jgi:trk system potassium uptake protein TrkH
MMVNWKLDLRLIALIELFIGALMGVPTIMAAFLGESDALFGFGVTYLATTLFCAAILIGTDKPATKNFHARDGFFVVTLTWIAATAFSALPLYVSRSLPDYPSAFFEMMSGFTTTGATTLSEIESLPRSILFWRSQTNWLGGMGIVVLFVALLPALGVTGTMLVGAESVGPTKDKLTPKIKTSALLLWTIYVGFSIMQIILLLLGGLSPYDAITITFSTMSTAGFSTMNNSIAGFESSYVDIVVTVFMVISGVNFALYWRLFVGKAKSVFRDAELRAYLGILGTSIIVSAAYMTISKTFPSFWTSLRYSAFQNTSMLTTTGFTTTNYETWPAFTQMILFFLFFIGGSAGSTAGGIKVVRVVALFKLARYQLKKRVHPKGVFQVRLGQTVLTSDVINAIATFVGMYIFTGLLGALVLSFSGTDLLTSLQASFLCLGNVGVGFAKVGPQGDFGFFPSFYKWVCSFLMLVGRLELFTVYVLFTKTFWKR